MPKTGDPLFYPRMAILFSLWVKPSQVYQIETLSACSIGSLLAVLMNLSGLSASFFGRYMPHYARSQALTVLGKAAAGLKGSIPECARGMTNGVLEFCFEQTDSGW
jgi:hypothetical protein